MELAGQDHSSASRITISRNFDHDVMVISFICGVLVALNSFNYNNPYTHCKPGGNEQTGLIIREGWCPKYLLEALHFILLFKNFQNIGEKYTQAHAHACSHMHTHTHFKGHILLDM